MLFAKGPILDFYTTYLCKYTCQNSISNRSEKKKLMSEKNTPSVDFYMINSSFQISWRLIMRRSCSTESKELDYRSSYMLAGHSNEKLFNAAVKSLLFSVIYDGFLSGSCVFSFYCCILFLLCISKTIRELIPY